MAECQMVIEAATSKNKVSGCLISISANKNIMFYVRPWQYNSVIDNYILSLSAFLFKKKKIFYGLTYPLQQKFKRLGGGILCAGGLWKIILNLCLFDACA